MFLSLRSNISLYSVVSLRPLPTDYVPSVVMLPGTCQTQGNHKIIKEFLKCNMINLTMQNVAAEGKI